MVEVAAFICPQEDFPPRPRRVAAGRAGHSSKEIAEPAGSQRL